LSEIRATTISDAAGTGPITLTKQSAAKAFARWNMVTLQNTFNVSSGVDNGTGDGSVNLTSSMSDSLYSVIGSGEGSANTAVATFEKTNTTTASRMDFNITVNEVLGNGFGSPTAFGDLA
jgi:hypothetical protein